MHVLADNHIHISDARGITIFSNMPSKCLTCMAKCVIQSEIAENCGTPGKRRRGKLVVQDGSVFLCTPDKEALKSAKLFKREQSQSAELCKRLALIKEEISKQESAKARRLLHNLTTLNAHAIQDLYSVIPQEDLGGFTRSSFRTQREYIRSKLVEKPDAAASLFINALKNQAAVKNELSVFKRLYESIDSISRNPHALHKVVLNVANYFFQDFADRQVRMSIGESDDRVTVNYETVQVALYHVFDNAAKYCKSGTSFKVDFARSDSSVCILFDMISLFVENDERGKIYDDDYSGVMPRATETAGQGMGMGTIRQLLGLNNAEIDAQWGSPLDSDPPGDDIRYAHNTVIVRFRNEK